MNCQQYLAICFNMSLKQSVPELKTIATKTKNNYYQNSKRLLPEPKTIATRIVSVSAMLVYTCQKNIAQAFILERYFFVSICPAAIPGTCLSVFLAAVLPLC